MFPLRSGMRFYHNGSEGIKGREKNKRAQIKKENYKVCLILNII